MHNFSTNLNEIGLFYQIDFTSRVMIDRNNVVTTCILCILYALYFGGLTYILIKSRCGLSGETFLCIIILWAWCNYSQINENCTFSKGWKVQYLGRKTSGFQTEFGFWNFAGLPDQTCQVKSSQSSALTQVLHKNRCSCTIWSGTFYLCKRKISW